MGQVLLHVGLPKTGTKWLQRRVFSSHREIDYLGKPYRDPELAAVFRSLKANDALDYDEDAQSRRFEARVRDRIRSSKLVVLSEEGVAESIRCRGTKADRLKTLFGAARVLIVARNQLDALPSYYLSVQRHARLKYAGGWSDWIEEQARRREEGILPTFNAYSLAKCYEARFGRPNLLVLCYEELRDDPARFVGRICAFAGIDPAALDAESGAGREHERESAAFHRYQRIKSALFPNLRPAKYVPDSLRRALMGLMQRGPRAAIKLTPDERSRLSEYYSEGNARLAAEFGLPLRSFGYPLPPHEPARIAAPQGLPAPASAPQRSRAWSGMSSSVSAIVTFLSMC